MAAFKKGQVVQWKAAGKVARLEGTAGKIVSGKIQEVCNKTKTLSVMPDHRAKRGAPMHGMGAHLEFDQIITVPEPKQAAKKPAARRSVAAAAFMI
jgi:hypothetical protein